LPSPPPPAASATEAPPPIAAVGSPVASSVASEDAASTGSFNLQATLDALRDVHYGSCVLRASGRIAISFAPSGRVSGVRVLRGRFDDAATACLLARFGAARTPAFHGETQTVTAEIAATR
jgi:hypothetical protein